MAKVADQTNRKTASPKEEGKGRKSFHIIPKTVLKVHKCTLLWGEGGGVGKLLRTEHFFS